MGGEGSGGRRAGTGPKPKDVKLARLHNSRDRGTRPKDDASNIAPPTTSVVMPPDDLPPDELAIWRRLAPHALREQTLTPETAHAFEQLCKLEVRLAEVRSQLKLDGLMVNVVQVDEDTGAHFSVGDPKAHPLLTHERGLVQRISIEHLKFRLSPDGKQRAPAEPEKKEPSQLERLQAQAAAMRRPVGLK